MSYHMITCPLCLEVSMYENPILHSKTECLDCGKEFEINSWI